MGCHFLLQGTLPTQEVNLAILHWQVDSPPPCHLWFPQNLQTSRIDLHWDGFHVVQGEGPAHPQHLSRAGVHPLPT